MLLPGLVQQRLDALAKPPGSLGKLERLAVRLADTQGSLEPRTRPRRAILFAGDHGVVEEGVGIWPSDVTAAMVRLIVDGRSASAALARTADADLVVIDAGTRGPSLGPLAGYRDWRIRQGTRNLARGAALTVDEFQAAWAIGERAVSEAVTDGVAVLAVGEMGIGNTTPAACLIALLTGAEPDDVVGPGAGATAESLARKRQVVAEALSRARDILDSNSIGAMAAVAGFEIVALAGCIAAARRAKLTVVLDGLITAAAALIAQRVDRDAISTAIAAHQGSERGHAIALSALGLEPFLDWDLRLGEGTGAILLLPLLDAAAALLTDVATLADVLGGKS